mgnify:CR=1 FL=1
MQDITLSFQRDATPLYKQLYRHIAGEIHRGNLKEDTRLPSKRALVKHLKISMSTVESAYSLLQSEGYIRAEAKRGFFVQGVMPLSPPAAAPADAPMPAPLPLPPFDFSTSAVDQSLFPFRTWSRLFRETLRDTPRLLEKGDAQGDEELRDSLAKFLYQYRGVRCTRDSLLIGAGVDYLLYVLFCLLPGGVSVAAEDPGYQGAYRLAQRHKARVLPLPLDEQGIRPDALYQAKAKLVYVTPSHQFPLGLSMPIGRRTALLDWAQQTGGYIIEDDYDSEFRHTSRPLPALQGLGCGNRVIYIGTFSRSLAPSMRIAYMVLPPDLMDAWRQLFRQGGDTVSRFDQQTLHRLIAGGHFARHLRRAGSAYTKRCKKLCDLLLTIPQARVQGEEAGLHFLLTIPQKSERELVARAQRRGLRLHGLSEYCHRVPPLPSTVVMGFAGLRDEELEPAVALLREIWDV